MHFSRWLTTFALICSLVSACASSHPACDVPDAAVAADDARAPCPAPLVDEGDACVGWRGIPSPPCEPEALVWSDGDVAVQCPEGTYALLPDFTWEQRDGATTLLAQDRGGPADFGAGPRMAVSLANGRQAATHGDLYAIPAAWRTDARGQWRDTVPPPSAFLTHAAVLSDHEALFVGRHAYVLTLEAR